MLTLHLLRHGDTAASADGTFCGDLDPPLAPSGVAQAERLALLVARLAPRALYVSPKLRARSTVQPAARLTGLVPRVESGLREIAYGDWEGKKEAEVAATAGVRFAEWASDPATMPPPGGESAFDIAARAMRVVDAVREAHREGHVVVVSHKATIRVLTCALLGMHVGRFRDRVACPTASRTTFEFGARGPMLVCIADTSHLA